MFSGRLAYHRSYMFSRNRDGQVVFFPWTHVFFPVTYNKWKPLIHLHAEKIT